MEIWKDVKDYEGLYQVSNLGRVKSLERYQKNHSKLQKRKEKIISINVHNKNGYCSIQLYKNGVSKRLSLHRLVALHFIPNPHNKPQINHIDGDKLNNDVKNLEWVTQFENHKHAYDKGLMTKKPITNGEEIFDSIASATKWLRANGFVKASNGTVCKACQGQRKTAYG